MPLDVVVIPGLPGEGEGRIDHGRARQFRQIDGLVGVECQRAGGERDACRPVGRGRREKRRGMGGEHDIPQYHGGGINHDDVVDPACRVAGGFHDQRIAALRQFGDAEISRRIDDRHGGIFLRVGDNALLHGHDVSGDRARAPRCRRRLTGAARQQQHDGQNQRGRHVAC